MPGCILAELSQDGPGRISLSGDISFQNSPALLKQSRLHFTAGGHLEISLEDVSRVDSSAVALMLEWYRLAEAGSMDLIFTKLPKTLMDLIRVFNLDSRLPIRE